MIATLLIFGSQPFAKAPYTYLLVGLFLSMNYYLSCLETDDPNRESEGYNARVLSRHSRRSQAFYERRVLEFKTLAESIADRGQGSVISGTIFVTASLLILAQASSIRTPMKDVLAFASLGIYTLWLFGILYTAKQFDAATYARLRLIETFLNIEAYSYLAGIAKRSISRKYVRSPVWGIMLFALTFIGFLVLLF